MGTVSGRGECNVFCHQVLKGRVHVKQTGCRDRPATSISIQNIVIVLLFHPFYLLSLKHLSDALCGQTATPALHLVRVGVGLIDATRTSADQGATATRSAASNSTSRNRNIYAPTQDLSRQWDVNRPELPGRRFTAAHDSSPRTPQDLCACTWPYHAAEVLVMWSVILYSE